METALPIGSWVAYTYRGELEYATIVDIGNGSKGIQVGQTPKVGTIVNRVVWKGDNLMVKKQFTMK